MAKIKSVKGRQVFDSRGNPTVEAEIFLDDDTSATAISVAFGNLTLNWSIKFCSLGATAGVSVANNRTDGDAAVIQFLLADWEIAEVTQRRRKLGNIMQATVPPSSYKTGSIHQLRVSSFFCQRDIFFLYLLK